MNNKLMYLTGIIAFSFWYMISYLSLFIPFDLRLRAMNTTPFSDRYFCYEYFFYGHV